jgi:dCMP deaminase
MSNWDQYFYNICKSVSLNSKCLSRQIGAIIVKDKSIISTGYNGPPRGVEHCSMRYLNDKKLIDLLKSQVGYGIDLMYEQVKDCCPRRVLGYTSGNGLEYCIAGHAERNCIINAARVGTCIKDGILYCNCPIPCTPCLIEIINSGIKEVVVTAMDSYDMMGDYLIEGSGLKVRIFDNRKD